MPVEDDPLFEQYSKALDKLKEAKDRLREAATKKDTAINVCRKDWQAAQSEYEMIAAKIGSGDPDA